jgi:hypothetical protein
MVLADTLRHIGGKFRACTLSEGRSAVWPGRTTALLQRSLATDHLLRRRSRSTAPPVRSTGIPILLPPAARPRSEQLPTLPPSLGRRHRRRSLPRPPPPSCHPDSSRAEATARPFDPSGLRRAHVFGSRSALTRAPHPTVWLSSIVPNDGTCASCATHEAQTYSPRWLSGGAGGSALRRPRPGSGARSAPARTRQATGSGQWVGPASPWLATRRK